MFPPPVARQQELVFPLQLQVACGAFALLVALASTFGRRPRVLLAVVGLFAVCLVCFLAVGPGRDFALRAGDDVAPGAESAVGREVGRRARAANAALQPALRGIVLGGEGKAATKSDDNAKGAAAEARSDSAAPSSSSRAETAVREALQGTVAGARRLLALVTDPRILYDAFMLIFGLLTLGLLRGCVMVVRHVQETSARGLNSLDEVLRAEGDKISPKRGVALMRLVFCFSWERFYRGVEEEDGFLAPRIGAFGVPAGTAADFDYVALLRCRILP